MPELAPVSEQAAVSDNAASVKAQAVQAKPVTPEPFIDTDLTAFEQKCIAGYAVDAYFSDAAHLSELPNKDGLWWTDNNQPIVNDV